MAAGEREEHAVPPLDQMVLVHRRLELSEKAPVETSRAKELPLVADRRCTLLFALEANRMAAQTAASRATTAWICHRPETA